MVKTADLDKKFVLPTILVLFGATGDLVRRKIIPALFHLYEHDRLPGLLQIVGFARRPVSDEAFRQTISEILRSHDLGSDRARVDAFLTHFTYHQGNFNRLSDYRTLAERLGRVDEGWQVCANKLYYLAVPPDLYRSLFTHLAQSGLTIPCGPDEGWTRVIVEKPFGRDLHTAQTLDRLLGQLFKEEQIYRIDHYPAKEILQNILAFRFSNNLLEDSWSNRAVERIDIRLWERIGVEDRGAFYDGVGALRDMGQNHLLQMLALVTMDRPATLTADAIRRERAQVLGSLMRPTTAEAARLSTRAQYTGYLGIKGVAADSPTETYFRIETQLGSPRWQGVPISLESGKRLHEVRKEIVVTFRHTRPCLCPTGTHLRNRVIFQLEPVPSITIDFWAKQPGFDFAIAPQTFKFSLKDASGQRQYVTEYSKLLLDCIGGDQTLFMSTEEIAAMWAGIDPYLSAWRRNFTPLRAYAPDSNEAIATADAELAAAAARHHHRDSVGMVGLGKMGGNLVRQLLEKGWTVVGWDPNPAATHGLADEGMVAATDLADLADNLRSPRVMWLMIPAGTAVDETITSLLPHLSRGDTLIDGGNSRYQDTIRRARALKGRGITLLDVGVSGGPYGARTGAVLLVGGETAAYHRLQPLLRDLAAPGGVAFFPGVGAGHFVKMIHNGIEYGMMAAIAEGFDILRAAPFKLDLTKVADVYNHGSVIESRLVGWLGDAFRLHGEKLAGVSGTVAHTGEGAWTVEAAKRLKLEAKIIAGALDFRKQSVKHPSYAGQVLSALREQFGGHAIK